MKITSAEFVKSVVDVDARPRDRLAEIAFAGRSNVGKSSLINCLLNRKKLAKTSSTPGKTRQLNFFRVNNCYYFVDLPGYGFARVSAGERAAWQRLIESYIRRSEQLKGVVAIIDSRIGPTELDVTLLQWLKQLQVQTLVVATKADKLSRNQLTRKLADYSTSLAAYLSSEILAFSSVTGAGKRELFREIIKLLE